MSKSGVALQARIWTVQFYCFTVNVFCGEVTKKKDWNKGAWIILWWSGGVGEELGNWTSGGLSVSGDCSVLFIQKASRDFLYYWDYVVGTGLSKVSIVLFCVCFIKKMLNLRIFTACLFSFNPWITEQKNPHKKPGAEHVASTYSLNRETIWERLHIGKGKILTWHELVMLVRLLQLSS